MDKRKLYAESRKGKGNPMYGRRRELAPKWKGGKIIHKQGYVMIYCPDHPAAIGGGYVFEHRLVMEKHLGRPLLPSEVCHHINGIVDDNRIENLMLFSSQSGHIQRSARGSDGKFINGRG